jgi:hypothetical protein
MKWEEAAMTHDLLTEYDRLRELVQDAEDQTAKAKGRYESALGKQKALEKQQEAVRVEIERALSIADEPPAPGAKAKRPDIKTKPPQDSGHGVRPSYLEVIHVIPRDGDVKMDDLRKALPGLLDGALNTRVAKMKKAGLLESGGWGRYQLTDEGRKHHGQRLRVVAENGD